MVNPSCQSIGSQSGSFPTIFDGTDFLNWKSKMEFYLKSVNIKCWDVVINGFDSVDITFNARAMKIIFDYLSTEQFNLICHCLSAQEIWDTLNTKYGRSDNGSSKPEKVNSDSEFCLTGFTNENSEGSDDGESTDAEVENFSYEDLVYMCVDLTKSVDKLKSKNKSLKSRNSELTSKIDDLESQLEYVKNSSNSVCKNCLKLKTNLVHLNKNIQKFEKEILILKENKIELSSLNNFLQKEFEIFKTDIYSKFEIAENENLVKSGLILKELENEIEKSKNFESEKQKRFELEISESQAKIKLLENENLVLKQSNAEQKIAINNCSNLLKENSDLKSKIQRLESTLDKFSNGEKSLNMLLQNQVYSGNKSGLGFGKNDGCRNQNSCEFKNPSNHFRNVCFENFNSENFKGFVNHNRNEDLFYNKPFKPSWISNENKTGFVKFKSIWVPKGTKVNSDGLLYKQVWVPKHMNETVSGFTNFVRPLDPINY